jgi:sugar/nucleoside kinase (ribokinase family)
VPPIELTAEDAAAAAEADWIHVDQTGYPALPELHARGVRVPVSLDGGNFVSELRLDSITLYAPTERALLARYPDRDLDGALLGALDEGPRFVVATCGDEGSVGVERTTDGVRRHEVAAFELPVVSTLGAGDVFHGALLAALLDGRALRDALVFANAAAGLSCRALDGRSGIPTRREVEQLVAASAARTEAATQASLMRVSRCPNQ